MYHTIAFDLLCKSICFFACLFMLRNRAIYRHHDWFSFSCFCFWRYNGSEAFGVGSLVLAQNGTERHGRSKLLKFFDFWEDGMGVGFWV